MGFRPWVLGQYNVEIACDVGVEAASVLHDILYWVKHNETCEKKETYKDGKYWTYGHYEDIARRFPFLGSGNAGKQKVGRLIRQLESAGYIEMAKYANPSPAKRLVPTVWIAPTAKAFAHYTTLAQIDDSSNLNSREFKNELSRVQIRTIESSKTSFPSFIKNNNIKEYKAKASDTASPAVAASEKIGISRDQYKMLAGEFGESVVLAQIPIIAARNGIRNPYALIRKACAENWASEQEKTCVKSAWEQAVDMLGGMQNDA